MTLDHYKIPVLLVAGLALMGGLAWWFMRTELPPTEVVVPKETASPAGPAKSSPAPAKPKAVPRNLKALDLEALLAMALQEGRGREQERAAVVAEISKRQAQAAVLDKLSVGEAGSLRTFTAELLKTWSQTDRDAALAWWRGVKPGTAKDLLAKPLVDGCLKGAGKEGSGFYFVLEAGERMSLNKDLPWAVWEAGGGDGLDALFSFQDVDRTKAALVARQNLLRRATDAMRAKEGPEATAAWLGKYGAAPFAYGAAFDTLVSAWAQKDAPAAAAWAVELPSNTHLWGDPLGLPRAVKEWAKRDMPAASRWADTQSRHRNYDIVAESISEVLAGEDFKAATAWVESIRDAERKRKARKKLGLPGK